MAARTKHEIELPGGLIEELTPLFEAKGVTLNDVCRLYLRSLVTASKHTRAVGLDDAMPLGRLKGEPLRDIILSDAKYVSWLLGNVSSFKIDFEALVLLEETMLKQEAA